jgi:co-chaperonin GroES (HSP10)
MEHEIDPKQKILDEIGDISNIEIFNNNILVAVYQRPAKTKSGIFLTDKTTEEDRFQSKVGLLVKVGSRAFEPNDEGWFDGVKFNLNDWIVFRPSDGWNITVNGVLCRMLSDTQVRGRSQYPDEVW